MFIQTESTPNPNSLKFVLEREIYEGEAIEFNNQSQAENSPLAQKLLSIDGVEKILIFQNFITVNKNKYSWDQLKASVLHVISDFISSGLNAINVSENMMSSEVDYNAKDKETVDAISAIISKKVKPAVAQDGGDINFVKYNEGIVFLELKGSCAGCPSATLTLKNGIENILKHHIPEIKRVEQIR